jgi:hypothetical protein
MRKKYYIIHVKAPSSGKLLQPKIADLFRESKMSIVDDVVYLPADGWTRESVIELLSPLIRDGEKILVKGLSRSVTLRQPHNRDIVPPEPGKFPVLPVS